MPNVTMHVPADLPQVLGAAAQRVLVEAMFGDRYPAIVRLKVRLRKVRRVDARTAHPWRKALPVREWWKSVQSDSETFAEAEWHRKVLEAARPAVRHVLLGLAEDFLAEAKRQGLVPGAAGVAEFVPALEDLGRGGR